MENFSTVLWIVVIAAAMIFNVVSQSRKQAKKQARHTPVRQEVQPAVAPGATPTMAPSAGFEDAAPAAGSGHTAPLSGRSDVQKGRMTATEHPHAAYDDAQEDATAEITEDFDLRRAVIYSEILKPKFDE